MSTFNGIIEEFPFIRIDYFRKNPDKPPPLACFLSHVHSDHLQGLESLYSPFIYCSATTRELLLRIEKYPHRMNFSKGILESRKQHYKHLAKLLRPVPLNTPTELELTPRLRIRVTLLDANHCPGAVMFVIEGDGRAILYTGDIRAENWWVNSLVRNPVLITYTLGDRSLDKIYLDTTFAVRSNAHCDFPSKAEGLKELLKIIQAYPDDTIFYLRAWTFGYEEVWLALATALHTTIHVDRYQLELYRSLSQCSQNPGTDEFPFLNGFRLGNRVIPGCLTADENSRIHSCDLDIPCPVIASQKAVFIMPIVTRTNYGTEVPEVGSGGGIGDLYQSHELELPDELAVKELEKLCLEQIQDTQMLSELNEVIVSAFKSKNRALSLDRYGIREGDNMPLKKLVVILSQGQSKSSSSICSDSRRSGPMSTFRGKAGNELPSVVRFPYSRHSSYAELCELVSVFRPKDIYPCTVNPNTWSDDVSMRTLFGHLCSSDEFSHDRHMGEAIDKGDLRLKKRARWNNSSTQTSNSSSSIVIENDNDSYLAAGTSPKINSEIAIGNIISNQSSTAFHQREKSCHSHIEGALGLPYDGECSELMRNRIHDIRDSLEQLKDRILFSNGPLPASIRCDLDREGCDGDEGFKPAPDPEQPQLKCQRIRSPLHTPRETNCEMMVEAASRPSETIFELETQISLPDSVFDDGSQPPPQRQPESQGREEQPTIITASGESCYSDVHARAVTVKQRKAAYCAARARNYDAWSQVALLSAGNNHTEEEIEL